MCVRDLTRGKCQAWRRTASKANSRQADKVSSSKISTRRRTRRMKRREEIDLLCSELLSQNDVHSYHADISYLKLEYEPLSPLMTDISFTSCPATDPIVYALLLSPESAYCNVEQTPWSGVEQVSSPLFGYGEEISVEVAFDEHRTKDCRNWTEKVLVDGIDWHDFSPDQRCSLPIDEQNGWQCAEVETFLPSGSSLQSNSLPSERRPVQVHRPSRTVKERRTMERVTNSRSRKKLEFSASAESLEKLEFSAKAEFRETMEFLVEKESATNYRLSNAYIEKLTVQHSSGLHVARRSFVDWILKVVDRLHLSSLTAAQAVSLFDRYLSQRLITEAQDEENDELPVAATACVWIAAKMEDSGSSHLSSMRTLAAVEYDEVEIRKMEVLVLKSLGWRMLGVTAADFLANMIAQLPALGLPADLLTSLGYRSEEIMRLLLPEVEFLAYQPSVVSFSVMQCLLDECVPVHTAALMAGFHPALAVDVKLKENCYRTLMDLVVADKTQVSLLQSSNRGCVNFK